MCHFSLIFWLYLISSCAVLDYVISIICSIESSTKMELAVFVQTQYQKSTSFWISFPFLAIHFSIREIHPNACCFSFANANEDYMTCLAWAVPVLALVWWWFLWCQELFPADPAYLWALYCIWTIICGDIYSHNVVNDTCPLVLFCSKRRHLSLRSSNSLS